jgi:y4mF family transcriptional regulator
MMLEDEKKIVDEVKIRSAKDLGISIKKFRNSQKMTQADILGLANTGNRFIVELENGKGTVQFNKVLDVLNTLGLEMVIKKKSNL